MSSGNGFDISLAPGQITDTSRPIAPSGIEHVDLDEITGYGYEWISFQVVNGANVTGVVLDEGRRAGFPSTGAWGVVYEQGDFRPFGARLAKEAIRQGADHVLVDAEECAKFTRAGRGMRPIVDGLRDGGWTGPVHLSTLGAPVNGRPHGPNDFEIDAETFLETGGGVQPQAYFNAYPEYEPRLCADYWKACGVPPERLNITIGLYVEIGSAKEERIPGADWVPLLEAAGVDRNFNVFMVQHGTDDDWHGLWPLSKPRPPAPEPAPTPEPEEDEMEPVTDQQGRDGVMFAVQAAAQNWASPKPKGRLTVAGRICGDGCTDDKWNKAREEIVPILDKYGIELPQ